MKTKLTIVLLAIGLAANARLDAAHVPAGFNYQGRLLDASGNPLPDGNYDISFRVFDAVSGGSPVWGPQTIEVPLVEGLFNAVLGPADGSGNNILEAFAGSERFLELQIGANSPIAPRQRILAVPYAIRSESAGRSDTAALADDATTVAGQNLAEVLFGGDNTFALLDINKIPDAITRDDEIANRIRDALATDPGDWGVGSFPDAINLQKFYVEQPNPANGAQAVMGDATAATGETYGLYGRSSSTTGRGTVGYAASEIGYTIGVYGLAESADAMGVLGQARSSTGRTFGVRGESVSSDGRGVLGMATTTEMGDDVRAIGVHGVADNVPNGVGVLGHNLNTNSGVSVGAWGRVRGPTGRGVYGQSESTNGVNYGVWGQVASDQGRAVFGNASSSSGINYGIYGQSASTTGRGVFGHAYATTGVNYGVFGRTDSPEGYAGYFTGVRSYFQGDVGIGTPTPQAKLDVVGNVRISGDIVDPTADQSSETLNNFRDTVALRTSTNRFAPNGNLIKFRHHRGTPGPGATSDKIEIMVDGVEYFTATRGKTFVIQHPVTDSQYLVHATLEGPENAVYYRGEARLSNGSAEIELPHYFEALTSTENRTVQLTPVDGFDRLAVRSKEGALIRDGRFAVISDNSNSTQRFTWEVKAVRKDIEPLEVEVSKADGILMGDGPYTYLLKRNQDLVATPAR